MGRFSNEFAELRAHLATGNRPQTEAFLEQQAAQWTAVSTALLGWLTRLCSMYDRHRSATSSDESGEFGVRLYVWLGWVGGRCIYG